MKEKKLTELSFVSDAKESIANRLKKLIGNRSVRAAARDWGLSFSTLNNYLHRGTEPSLGVAMKISQVEQVSVEWIASGVETKESTLQKNEIMPVVKNPQMEAAWHYMFCSLRPDEIDSLIRVIHRKGVQTIVALEDDSNDIEQSIDKLSIRPSLKQAIKVALAGDEEMDKEILLSLEGKQNTTSPGCISPEEQKKHNIG